MISKIRFIYKSLSIQKKSILLSSSFSVSNKILAFITNFILIPQILSNLGRESYSIWIAISSIFTFLGFADFGLSSNLVNEVSKFHRREKRLYLQKVISDTFFTLVLISLVLFSILLPLFYFIDWSNVFNFNKTYLLDARNAMLILSMSFLINLPFGIVQRLYDGLQKGYVNQIYLTLSQLISFGLTLIALFNKLSLPWVVLSSVLGSNFTIIFSFLNFLVHKIPDLRPKFKFFTLSGIKKIFNNGIYFFLLTIIGLALVSVDSYIIANTIGFQNIASYEIVKKIYLTTLLTQFVIQPLWPIFSAAIHDGQILKVKLIMKKMLLYTSLVAIIVALPITIYGNSLIEIWLGKNLNLPFSLFLGFFIYIILINHASLFSSYLNSNIQFLKFQLLIHIILFLISIFLKYYFSKVFGLSGIIWASVFAYLFAYTIPTTVHFIKFIRRS